jgi:hypothetical protein
VSHSRPSVPQKRPGADADSLAGCSPVSIKDVFETALAVLGSIGGGGLIVWRLSGWLGKVWAERLMERERQDYRKELERLRAELDGRNATALEQVRAEWDVLKTKVLGAHAEKIAHYQNFTDVLAPMAADVARPH